MQPVNEKGPRRKKTTAGPKHAASKRKASRRRRTSAPGPKLGVLYPFRLPDSMRDPILGGYGINPITDTTNYQVRDARDGVGIDPDGQSLKAGVDRLIQDNCKV